MQYFKHLINKFCFKVKSSNLFKFFFGCVFLFFFLPNVNASEITFGSGAQLYLTSGSSTYLQISDSVNSLPKLFSIPGQSTSYGGALTLYLSPASGLPGVTTDNTIYNYIYFKVCSNAPFEYRITNSSTNQSYIMTGNYQSYDLGSSCSTSNYTGTMKIVGIPIGKWYLNDVAEQFEVASYFTMYNSDRYTNYTTIYQIFLSDTDLLQTYRDRDALNSKLNDIDIAISNMQNSINNNLDSESAAIQNKIDSAKNQAHSDHQALMNQDHTYNNNASDTVPNSSDINSVLNKQNTLSSDLDLDVSTLDIQLNTDATTWIWGIVNNIRTINGKITLLFTTILSLAIIKMVLNR